MTPERFARIDELFNAALDLPAPKRRSFLERECEGDPELLKAVSEMVLADEDPDAAIDNALVEGAQAWAIVTEEQVIGQRLGPYRLTGFLGRGGMGAVYRATRDDSAFQKEVAIKLLRGGMDSRSVLRRFEQERQILARLEHPHIARLLDGGTGDNGLPYLVMEFVEDGITVTQYCNESALPLEKRLLLFLDICSAVGYAHQLLIVHRDLKPGNILVDKSGSVKLLDFGIARVLSDNADQTVTVAGAQMLTPEYASPEQVRGEPVSTATDVYSLGIILYELLTNKKAQPIEETSLAGIARAVCETIPVRPSQALVETGGPIRGRDLRGDLDNIILKALHKDRDRRYASVERFAEDIRAYLQGLPVKARPDSFGYRASKFLKRNRIAVVSGATAALLLTGTTFLLWLQVQKTRRQFEQVRQLSNSFLFDFYDAVAGLSGGLKARELVVEKGLQYLEPLARESAGDPALAREVGLGYERVGDVQGNPLDSNIGDTKGALVSYAKSITLLEHAWQEEGRNVAGRKDLQRAYYKLGSLQRYASNTKGALESFQRAIQHGEVYVKEAAGDVAGLRQLARAHDQMGRMASVIGIEEGRKSAERAVQIREELIFKGIGDRAALGELASSYATLGTVLARMGKLDEALGAYQKSLMMQERIAATNPDHAAAHRTVMIAMSHVGDTLGNTHMLNLGRFAEGAAIYGKVVDKGRWLVAVDPRDRKAQLDLAFGLLRWGNLLRAAGEFTRAGKAMEESRALLEGLLRDDPENGRLAQNLTFLHHQFAELYADQEQWAKAVAANELSMAMSKKLMKRDARDASPPRMLLEALWKHVDMLDGAGQRERAVEAAHELAQLAGAGQFVKVKEPRVRMLAARGFEKAAEFLPERRKELRGRAEAEWAAIERDGLLTPQLIAERDAFKKRLLAER